MPKVCITSCNSRSTRKTASIANLIIEEKVDILAITESWLRGDERDEIPIADIMNTLPHFAVHHVHELTLQ